MKIRYQKLERTKKIERNIDADNIEIHHAAFWDVVCNGSTPTYFEIHQYIGYSMCLLLNGKCNRVLTKISVTVFIELYL